MPSDKDDVAVISSKPKQFGLAALFWITFIVGLGITYLKRMASPEVMINACGAIVIGIIVGAVVGSLTGKRSDAFFWATLIAAFGYISTASDPRYTPFQCLAWALLGAITGALASTVLSKRRFLNAAICAIAAGIVMGAFFLFANERIRTADLSFDFYVAPFIGVAVALFVQLILWLESHQKMPRYVTATWLLAAVIAGNLLSS